MPSPTAGITEPMHYVMAPKDFFTILEHPPEARILLLIRKAKFVQ